MVFNWFRRKFDEGSDKSEAEKATPAPSQPESKEESSVEEPSTPASSGDDYLKWAKAAYQNIQKKQQQDSFEEETESETAETLPTTEIAVADVDADTKPVAVESLVSEPESPKIEEPEDTEAVETAEILAPDETPESVIETEESVATEPESTEETEDTAGPVPEAIVETPESLEEPEATATVETVEPEPIAPDETPESIVETEESVATESPTPAQATTQTPQTQPLSFLARAEAERQARLERLKAEAIETPVVEETPVAAPKAVEIPELPFDEGFVWSSEVLAAQGRRPEDISVEEITWLKKLRQGLDKTRRGLVNQLKAIVGQGPLNKAAVLEIEELLLQADVGIEATDYVIEALQARMREETLPPDAAIAYLKQILRGMLDRPLIDREKTYLIPEKDSFNIWLMTGVNGAGKTTTIGKLAHLAQKSDYNCLIAAADTFRAAAVEQVKVWGARSGIDVIANPGQNTDPAAVVFDAIAAARSRKTELLLVDTAGRLQNKKNLMDELNKIRRIIDKQAPGATIESLLVLDATLGQNGLRQAEVFAEAAQLSGVVLTKLDGTAKGGVALAVVQQLGLPIRFIGAGEGIEDLRPFSSYEFVEALLDG
ncbi:MAG: signal recognition particle-docking protein FtsY [Geitlerinemataceae cyanobacterium]